MLWCLSHRLWTDETTSRITVALFLANLEIPIVTTSLVAITNDLHGFERGSWIISAYLLGFVGTVLDSTHQPSVDAIQQS
jgi:MFS family permease